MEKKNNNQACYKLKNLQEIFIEAYAHLGHNGLKGEFHLRVIQQIGERPPQLSTLRAWCTNFSLININNRENMVAILYAELLLFLQKKQMVIDESINELTQILNTIK